jgi:alpha-tubulin suppressor-like RCC1 family protein
MCTGSVAACSSSSGHSEIPVPNTPNSDGKVAFELQIGPGVTLSTVRWAIHHPTLLSADRTGSVDVSHSQAVQFVVGGLPAGPGYTITLTGTTDGPTGFACSGTTAFDVAASSTTSVPLVLRCAGAPVDAGNNGSVVINVTTVVGRVATALSLSPGSHGCALLSDGTVKCWGYNVAGQLGDGTTTTSSTPVSVSNLSGATAVSTGNVHTCALLTGGTVECWGSQPALGNGTAAGLDDCGGLPCSMKPVPVVGLTGATAIAAGASHTCALVSGGTVQCWGDNGSGELGDGTQLSPQIAPVAVKGLSGTVTALSLGDSHTCALLSDSTVECWGYNYSGQLGNGTRGPDNCSGYPCSRKPVAVVGLRGVTAIAAGGSRTCALLSDGSATCWGFNDVAGELGNGTKTNSSVPVAVSNVRGATALAAGVYHTCALLTGGAVDCWGNNSIGAGTGQFGAFCSGATLTAPTPVGVPDLGGAATLSAGGSDTCALTSGGKVECCGRNALGQLGNGSTATYSATPVEVGL